MSQRKKDYASIRVAAQYREVSEKTLRRYISEGRLTGYRFGPRMIRVDLNELDALFRPIPTANGGAADVG